MVELDWVYLGARRTITKGFIILLGAKIYVILAVENYFNTIFVRVEGDFERVMALVVSSGKGDGDSRKGEESRK